MFLKKYKPTSSGKRFKTIIYNKSFFNLDKIPFLLTKNKNNSGRNNFGRITSYQKGSGAKQLYRKIDFKRTLFNINAKVIRIEYDPNRSANIALIAYQSGILSYILAPQNVRPLDIISTTTNYSRSIGYSAFVSNILVGSQIHNIEFNPANGGKIARAAGTYAILLDRYNSQFVIIRMPSGELRRFQNTCIATIGSVSNPLHHQVVLGKASTSRYLNRRPHVRGVAMNPIDHPHGGGQGKTSGGRPSVSPWGFPTKNKFKKRIKQKNPYIL